MNEHKGIIPIAIYAIPQISVVEGIPESAYAELTNDYELEDVKNVLAGAPIVVLADDPASQRYPPSTDASGKPDVFVGRLRRDWGRARGLN